MDDGAGYGFGEVGLHGGVCLTEDRPDAGEGELGPGVGAEGDPVAAGVADVVAGRAEQIYVQVDLDRFAGPNPDAGLVVLGGADRRVPAGVGV